MEPLFFAACEEVDNYFREGREYFNEIYVKKLAQTSAWYSRVPESTWPLASGTQQKGFRFGRGFFDPTKPWRKVISERCDANSCDSQPERVMRPGTTSYFWDLLRKELETEWFCVEDLMYRLLAPEEVEQIEATNAIITRSIHEEFSRASYVGASGHKWGAFVNPDTEFCALADDSFWFMQEYQGVGEGGFDTRYIYVKCTVAQLSEIAFLALDMLDAALEDLGDEDEAYRLDMRENGIEKLDIIVPDERVARKMFLQAKDSQGYWNANTDFDPKLMGLRLGVNRILGDYAIGYDKMALRYNADSTYNATLAAFDVNNTATWPRLVRVMKYREVPAELGYHYLPNNDYKQADFGITVCWMPNAMRKWRNPSWTGTGEVKMEAKNYAGEWTWRRPDWECNRKRKMGFFESEHRLAMQIADPTLMHSFLTRLDHSRNFQGSACALNVYVAPDAIDTYVCQPEA